MTLNPGLSQVAEAPNEKSMITYLSLYAAAKKPEKKKPKKKEPEPAAPPVVFFEAPTDPELLRKINALFDAMDVDGDNSLTKFELLEFLRECKPRDMSVSKVQVCYLLDSRESSLLFVSLKERCSSVDELMRASAGHFGAGQAARDRPQIVHRTICGRQA